MRNDVLVVPVLHAEALWDNTELSKAQSLIQVQGMEIGDHNGIELEDAETKPGTCFQ